MFPRWFTCLIFYSLQITSVSQHWLNKMMHIFCCEVEHWKLRNSPEELWTVGQALSAHEVACPPLWAKRQGLPAGATVILWLISIWKRKKKNNRYNLSKEGLELYSPFCPVTIPLDGNVLPPRLCPKICMKKWKLVWMVHMFDGTGVCDIKEPPWLSFQITLQVTALKYGDYFQGALILLAMEV